MTIVEPEVGLLPALCSCAKASIDVGAHKGMYTRCLLPLSRQVFAFEPYRELCEQLRLICGPERLTIVEKALSDRNGYGVINAPIRLKKGALSPQYSRASLVAPLKQLLTADPAYYKDLQQRSIRLGKLDDEAIAGVGFIKIDVEGAEEEVLLGARETITRDRPSMLIEIEERHRPGALGRIVSLLGAWDYDLYFWHETRLNPASSFDLERMQTGPLQRAGARPPRIVPGYVNNFVALDRSVQAKHDWLIGQQT